MTQLPVDPRRIDPYRHFRFRIRWDGRHVAGMHKCAGLGDRAVATVHRDDDEPRMSPASPVRTQHEPITLAHGVTHDAGFERWANRAWMHGSGPDVDASSHDSRRDILLEIYDEAGHLALAYRIFRCRVSEFQALPDLDANANAVAIQAMTLEHDGWERDDGAI
jgi:phage tail-like protein